MLIIIELYYVLCHFSQKLATHHFLKLFLLRGELMRFIIYVDSVQQGMRGLEAAFVKQHNLYILKNILTKKMRFMLAAIDKVERTTCNTLLLLLKCRPTYS